jgi:hypothetical protein
MTSVNSSASLVLRAVKGAPLTNNEGDGDFTSLDDSKLGSAAPIILGLLTMQQSAEVQNQKTAATGVVSHDFSTGAIWYHSAISANFTVNLINLPATIKTAAIGVTTAAFATAITLVLNQGSTGFFPNAFQIGGVAQTIRWANNTTPTPTSGAGKIDVVNFSIIQTLTPTWFVMGQLIPFA